MRNADSIYFVMQSVSVQPTQSLRPVRILRAAHLGMCFGVRDAVDLALKNGKKQALTILGDLVHNESVLADLRRNGIQIRQSASEVTTNEVMITAHGAS